MRVVIEKPLTWLESDRDGDRNRLMYAGVLNALRGLGLDFVEEPIRYGSDFVARVASSDGIRLSYHSIGNARNVWRLKETPIPYYYGIDRLGYSGWSELSVRPDQHEALVRQQDERRSETFCAGLAEWLRTNNLSKYRQADVECKLPQRYVFFPMQVSTDVVARHNRLDPIAVLRRASRYAARHGMPLVVKRHPYCRSWRVAAWIKWLALANRHVHVTTASITRLLPSCSAVLVGNSGVGLEALVYGKPVYSFAASEYELVTHPIRHLDELESIFAAGEHVRHRDAYRFVRYYLAECCFDARSADDTRKKIARIVRDAESGRWLPEEPACVNAQNDDTR